MTARQAWRESPAHLAETAFGGRPRHRYDHGLDAD
jgi:hypothetical protein